MLCHRLFALRTTVHKLGSQRLSRNALPCVSRRVCPAACSQRTHVAYAGRPSATPTSVCAKAIATARHVESRHDINGAAASPLVAVPSLTFQEAITTLEQYWAKQSGANCAILLPHNTEVRNCLRCRLWWSVAAALLPVSVSKGYRLGGCMASCA